MATKNELEEKTLFRLSKVVYISVVVIIVLVTLVVWSSLKENKIDTSRAYFTCNSLGNDPQALTDAEKTLLQNDKSYIFEKGTPENVRLSKECYKIYSGGKNPDLATSFDIQLFNEMQKGDNGKVYVIQGINQYTDYHFGYLFIVLFVEYIIFTLIKIGGLYIFGGKQAISKFNI